MSENMPTLDHLKSDNLDYSSLQGKGLTTDNIKKIAEYRIAIQNRETEESIKKEKELSAILAKLESIPEKSEQVTPQVQAKSNRDKSDSVTPLEISRKTSAPVERSIPKKSTVVQIKIPTSPKVIPTTQEAQKPIDKARIATYDSSIDTFAKGATDINAKYQDKTGLIGKTQDFIVESFGGKSAKVIYEDKLRDVRAEAVFLGNNIRKDAGLMGTQETNRLIAKLNQTIPGLQLSPVSIIDAGVASAVTLAHGANGIVEGTYASIAGVITGTVDLLKFSYKYTESWLGDAKYKNQIDTQMSQIWNYVAQNELGKMGSDIGTILAKEWNKVQALPDNERAFAISKIGGHVIGILITMRAGAGVVGHVSKMGGKVAQAEQLGVKLAQRGAEGSARAERVAALGRQAQRAKYGATAIDTVLNGIAETAISAALIKSLTGLKVTLASISLPNTEKVKAVQVKLSEVAAGLKENISDTTRKALEDIEDRLMSIRTKLEEKIRNPRSPEDEGEAGYAEVRRKREADKQAAQKKADAKSAEAKSQESVKAKEPEMKKPEIYDKPPKTFETAGKDPKQIIKEMAQYYHPDKNNHPDATRIMQMINALKTELKEGTDIGVRLEALAKDPHGQIGKTPGEKGNIKTEDVGAVKKDFDMYAKNFTEANLHDTAKTNSDMFGEMLLQKYFINQIKELIEQDMAVGIAAWKNFKKNPHNYMDSEFSALNTTRAERKKMMTEHAYSDEYKAYAKRATEKPANDKKFAESKNKIPVWNPDTTPINIPRSNGKLTGLEPGSYKVVIQDSGDYLVFWNEGSRSMQKRIPKNTFEQFNPHLSESKGLIRWNTAEFDIHLPEGTEYGLRKLHKGSYQMDFIESTQSYIIKRNGSNGNEAFYIKKADFDRLNPHIVAEKPSANQKTQPNQERSNTESNNNTPRRNTTAREWSEVPRAREVLSVGDLHGSMRAFEQNLQRAGAIDSSGKWIGGNKEIVFHGDILADRNKNSFDIFARIEDLQKQAREAGGKVSVLAGNHEDFAFAYLTGKNLPNTNDLTGKVDWVPNYAFGGSQSAGLAEFSRFGGANPQEMLMNMRKNPAGRKILEAMCNMKLAEHIDDTLFVHVVPNRGMLEAISRGSVDQINQIYQQGMRYYLLGEGSINAQAFDKVRELFLDTGSRNLYNQSAPYMTLKSKGINHIIHGHDSAGAGVHNSHGGVSVTGNDFGFEKTPGALGKGPSTVKIQKNGTFEYGDGSQMYRGDNRKAA